MRTANAEQFLIAVSHLMTNASRTILAASVLRTSELQSRLTRDPHLTRDKSATLDGSAPPGRRSVTLRSASLGANSGTVSCAPTCRTERVDRSVANVDMGALGRPRAVGHAGALGYGEVVSSLFATATHLIISTRSSSWNAAGVAASATGATRRETMPRAIELIRSAEEISDAWLRGSSEYPAPRTSPRRWSGHQWQASATQLGSSSESTRSTP
jgi:hypothetical protein